MEITAAMVRDLRERSGAGMMDCKKALTECEGDVDKAAEYLQIKGMAKAAKKADRVAAEGLVGTFVSADGKTGGIVEVNCETDFVARNDEFVAFVGQLAKHIVDAGINTTEALLASSLDGTVVEEIRKAKIASIGENITVRRAGRLAVAGEGVVGTYIHGGGSRGVLVLINANKPVAGSVATELGRDLGIHVAATTPLFARQDEVDADSIERERRIFTEQALESGKPAAIVEKMIEGRLSKWKQEICLLDQPFVKNPELTVAKEIKRVGDSIGTTFEVHSFLHFVRGEGIVKQETNLAAEVAALTK